MIHQTKFQIRKLWDISKAIIFFSLFKSSFIHSFTFTFAYTGTNDQNGLLFKWCARLCESFVIIFSIYLSVWKIIYFCSFFFHFVIISEARKTPVLVLYPTLHIFSTSTFFVLQIELPTCNFRYNFRSETQKRRDTQIP